MMIHVGDHVYFNGLGRHLATGGAHPMAEFNALFPGGDAVVFKIEIQEDGQKTRHFLGFLIPRGLRRGEVIFITAGIFHT